MCFSPCATLCIALYPITTLPHYHEYHSLDSSLLKLLLSLTQTHTFPYSKCLELLLKQYVNKYGKIIVK